MPRKPAQPDPEPSGDGAEATAPPSVEPAAAAPATEPVPSAVPPSFLDRVRDNRMGPLTAALLVALVVALLLAVLVPDRPNLYAYSVLALLLTAAVGFTVRYLSDARGMRAQATAFVATAIGIHVMATTGTIHGVGGGAASGLLARVGLEGPGFDDALLAALATPAISVGGLLSGLAAAIIVGWGRREAGDDAGR